MEQSPAIIENVYDTVAAEYAETFALEHEKKPMDQEVLRRFAREVEGRGPVWDLGCGPGQTTRFLKDLGLSISGLDLSEKLLSHARQSHPDLLFRKGDLLALDFAEDSLAGVVAFYSIVHFSREQVERAFCEVFRVMRPGGVFLFTYHVGERTIHVDEFLGHRISVDFMFFPHAFILAALRRAGWERVELLEREPYPDVEFASKRAYVFAGKPREREGEAFSP